MKKETIVVHSGLFHMDEILSIVLIEKFLLNERKALIIRTRDQEQIELERKKGAYIVDVGMVYDNIKSFDHHQEASLPSACSLVWKHIKEESNIKNEEIDLLVIRASNIDTGKTKARVFDFSQLVLNLNSCKNGFDMALEMVSTQIDIMVSKEEEVKIATKAIKKLQLLNGKVLWSNSTLPGLAKALQKEEFSHIEAFAYYQDGDYKISVISEENSTELRGRPLVKDELLASFVHESKFFAVLPSEDNFFKYLNKVYGDGEKE